MLTSAEPSHYLPFHQFNYLYTLNGKNDFCVSTPKGEWDKSWEK